MANRALLLGTLVTSQTSCCTHATDTSNDDGIVAETVALHLSATPVNRVNQNFASFNVDSSYNRGFFHVNFSNPNLRAAAKSLTPATLRFGGSGNDYLHYEVDYCNASIDDGDYYGCLNTSHWNDFHGLTSEAGLDFLFGISYDLATACSRNLSTPYVWDHTPALKLVQYARDAGQQLWGFELGNEVNNRGSGGHTFCNVTPAEQASAFESFYYNVVATVYPKEADRPVIVGPDTGYLNAPTWLKGFFSARDLIPSPFPMHAVTHHVYVVSA